MTGRNKQLLEGIITYCKGTGHWYFYLMNYSQLLKSSARSILSSDGTEIKNIIMKFSNLFEQYKEYEYEVNDWGGGKEKVVLGASEWWVKQIFWEGEAPELELDRYPLSDVWRVAAKELQLTAKKILEVEFFYRGGHFSYRSDKHQWFYDLLRQIFPSDIQRIEKELKEIPYFNGIGSIIKSIAAGAP